MQLFNCLFCHNEYLYIVYIVIKLIQWWMLIKLMCKCFFYCCLVAPLPPSLSPPWFYKHIFFIGKSADCKHILQQYIAEGKMFDYNLLMISQPFQSPQNQKVNTNFSTSIILHDYLSYITWVISNHLPDWLKCFHINFNYFVTVREIVVINH